jgi:hypothetical protein
MRIGLVTNTEHRDARTLLRRMLTASVDWYRNGYLESGDLFVFAYRDLET